MTFESAPYSRLDGVTVMLVEDHEDSRRALAEGLRGHGAKVMEAASAQVGLLLVQEHRPALIVADLELPEVDGYGFLKALRRLPEDAGGCTPAIALTVHNDPKDRRRSLLAGFRAHLAKPMSPTELAQKLASFLVLWRSR